MSNTSTTNIAAVAAALIATIAISVAPNLILFLFPNYASSPNNKTNNILAAGQALAAGGLMGDVFLHTLPHIIMENRDHFDDVGLSILLGFTTFFLLDLLMRCFGGGHRHHDNCPSSNGRSNVDVDTSSTVSTLFSSSVLLNLFADSMHNFTDGLAIGASFASHAVSSSTRFVDTTPLLPRIISMIQNRGGLVSLSVMFHEIPHELGDFSVLVRSGMSKRQAIIAQFSTAIAAFVGTILGLLPLFYTQGISEYHELMIPFTAGGFIYLAAVNILPELMENTAQPVKFKWVMLNLISFIAGIAFMYYVAVLEENDPDHDHHKSHDHRKSHDHHKSHDHQYEKHHRHHEHEL